jgi:hypothetical protein
MWVVSIGLPVQIYSRVDAECSWKFDAEECVFWQLGLTEMAEATDELVVPDLVGAVAQNTDVFDWGVEDSPHAFFT